MQTNWSHRENLLTIQAYVALLHVELRGERTNKSAIQRDLMTRLNNRSNGAVTMKFQNISAILDMLHFRWIDGYKPLKNFQADLAGAITECILADPQLLVAAEIEADRVPGLSIPKDILARLEDPPHQASRGLRAGRALEPGSSIRSPLALPDIYGREAANTNLGRQGEQFVLAYERERLSRLGSDYLSGKIEHVAEMLGDGLGYDIHSYERDGTDRFIEVKTTKYAKPTPFYLSPNEVNVSALKGPLYQLYRLFTFGEDTRLFTLCGALEATCKLETSAYRARAL